MKITIIYKESKIIVEYSSSIKVKDLIKGIRPKLAIAEVKQLTLFNDKKKFDCNDLITEENQKQEFVLVVTETYNITKVEDSEINTRSKEELIMLMTDATESLKIEKPLLNRARYRSARYGHFIRSVDFNPFLTALYMPMMSLNEENDELLNVMPDNFPLEAVRSRSIPHPTQMIHRQPNPEVIARLTDMGFPEERVRVALRMAMNNANRATDLLLTMTEEMFLENSNSNQEQNIQTQIQQAQPENSNNNFIKYRQPAGRGST